MATEKQKQKQREQEALLDQDWLLLRSALGTLEGASAEISEIELKRLERRVRVSLKADRRNERPTWVFRALAVAAASVMTVVGLAFITQGDPRGNSTAIPFQIVDSLDGTVQIHVADDGQEHRVTRLHETNQRNDVVSLESSDGRLFIDSQRQVKPGSIVFYRVD